MLQFIDLKKLSDPDLFVLLNYFQELDLSDRLKVVSEMNRIIGAFSHANGGIMTYPDLHPIIKRKAEENKGYPLLYIDYYFIRYAPYRLPQYNYIVAKNIFPYNKININIDSILNTQVSHRIELDDIIGIIMGISLFFNKMYAYHQSYVPIYILIKYILKYKIIAKVELRRLYYKEYAKTSGFSYYEVFCDFPLAKQLLDFIDNPTREKCDSLINKLSKLHPVINNTSVSNMLYEYISNFNIIHIRNLPMNNITWYNDRKTEGEEKHIVQIGTLDKSRYDVYLDSLMRLDGSSIPAKETPNMSVSESVKAAIIESMDDIEYAYIYTDNTSSNNCDRFLIRENGSDDIFLIYTEGAVVKGIEISRLLENRSQLLYMEFCDIDLDSKYGVILNKES